MGDPYDDERVYKQGWIAGSSGRQKSSNPYSDERAARWDLGWERGSSGGEYDGYA
jgi:ribosome modulation factor